MRLVAAPLGDSVARASRVVRLADAAVADRVRAGLEAERRRERGPVHRHPSSQVVVGHRPNPTYGRPVDEEVAAAKEGAWRAAVEIDGAFERGEIDAAGWHAAWLAIVEPAYLAADNPRAQSGQSGDAAGWEHARRLLVDAIPGNCTLLDVGCASGHLMESLVAWAAAGGIGIEPYGVDISARLADLARRRCPQWADRIFTANAATWRPPRRFDVVRTGLEYVPASHAGPYLRHLFDHVVAPGGRLIVGVYSEERDLRTNEDRVRALGYPVTGRTARLHRHPALAYKALWLDAPPLTAPPPHTP